jgi:hypothetical protein
MLSVTFLYCYADRRYAECRYAECHGAKLYPNNENFLKPLKSETLFDQNVFNEISWCVCRFHSSLIFEEPIISVKSYKGHKKLCEL